MQMAVDRLLRYLRTQQAWQAAQNLIPAAQHIFDIGCDDNYFLRQFLKLSPIPNLVGIDPATQHHHPQIKNIIGRFPEDLPHSEQQNQYDLIFGLAVFEHFPEASLPAVVRTLTAMLAPQGRVVLTIPQPVVDYLVNVLTMLHLIDAKAQAEHHHFDPARLPALMAEYFILEKHYRFECGMNNLMIFRRKMNE